MTPYLCKNLENAETVIKNRGPQKPVYVREREARKLVSKVLLYPGKHVLGMVIPTKHCKTTLLHPRACPRTYAYVIVVVVVVVVAIAIVLIALSFYCLLIFVRVHRYAC